ADAARRSAYLEVEATNEPLRVTWIRRERQGRKRSCRSFAGGRQRSLARKNGHRRLHADSVMANDVNPIEPSALDVRLIQWEHLPFRSDPEIMKIWGPRDAVA